MAVVTTRCDAAAVVSAVGAPTKEYAHPYSMRHRRLTAAGIEVAPHYHQLLVFLVDGWLRTLPTLKTNREMLLNDKITIEMSGRWNATMMIVRAIEVSHASCTDESRLNPQSHS